MLAEASQFRRTAIAFYTLWGVFCALLVVVAIQDHLYDPNVRWWEPILWEGSSTTFGTLWLIGRRRTAWRYQQYLDSPARWMARQLKWLPLFIVTFIVAVYSVRHGVYAMVGETYHHPPWVFVFTYEPLKLCLFLTMWLGVLFAFASFEQWQRQREQLLAAQKALAEAQLAQLKAQLRPHFLFNALNTISSLMHTNVDQADRMLARVGDLLRASLQAEGNLTTLSDELRILQLYAQIMADRFGDRLTLVWDIGDNVNGASIPSLLLQPLLENAFKHGVERSSAKETVRIAAASADSLLIITIHNTGSTLTSTRDDGIGIRNCRERLRVLYAEHARLDLTETPTGVQAQVTLPFSEQPT